MSEIFQTVQQELDEITREIQMALVVADGPGWSNWTDEKITKVEARLKTLENTYGNRRNGGLAGAVRDKVITESQHAEIVEYLDWMNA